MSILPTLSKASKSLLIAFAVSCAVGCAGDPNTQPLNVGHMGNDLSGDIYFPDGAAPFPAMVLVHGDGEITRDAYGYYKPFIQAFNDAGYAVATWDKPGVGRSTGDWLEQSMMDRTEEVLRVVDHLRQSGDIDGSQIGLIGFSQAGWVMPPAMVADPELTFMISVSPAINWGEQGRYMMKNRMARDSFDHAAVQEAIEWDKKVDVFFESNADYAKYLDMMKSAPACCNSVMPMRRFGFVSKNFKSDANLDLRAMRQPSLTLLGGMDQNVDAKDTALILDNIRTETGCDINFVVIPNADHSLFPSKKMRMVEANMSLYWRLAKVDFLGEGAFAEGVFSTLRSWLAQIPSTSSVCQ